MPEVTVRDAHRSDASAIGEVSAAAVPHLVRSAGQVAADMRRDSRLGRRRWVGLLGNEVVGTATARQVMERGGASEVFLDVQVRPDRGSQGVGTLLLTAASEAFPGATRFQAAGSGDPVSLSFGIRNGFLPEDEQPVARVDPRWVTAPDADACGLRAVTLEGLPDLRMLLETHNLATDGATDGAPGPGHRRLTMYQLRDEWWDLPDNAPGLSWGLLAEGSNGPVLASFTSVQVDRERRRAWSRTTATHPAYRDRGLAQWVKRRTLASLADAGVLDAWAPTHPENAPMLAVNDALGYRVAARAVRLDRRLRR